MDTFKANTQLKNKINWTAKARTVRIPATRAARRADRQATHVLLKTRGWLDERE